MNRYIIFWLYGCDFCEAMMKVVMEAQEWFSVRFHFIEVSGKDLNRLHSLVDLYERLYPDPDNQVAPILYLEKDGEPIIIEGYEDSLRETLFTILSSHTGISHPDISAIEENLLFGGENGGGPVGPVGGIRIVSRKPWNVIKNFLRGGG